MGDFFYFFLIQIVTVNKLMPIYLLGSGRVGAENTSRRLCMSQMQGVWYVHISQLYNPFCLQNAGYLCQLIWLTCLLLHLLRTFHSALPYKW